ncbi:MAG: ABC transporter permease [Galactobacter sp.]
MSSMIRSNVVAYRRRYTAVIAAIAIGVAFLTTTLLVSSTLRATLGASLGEDYQHSDLVINVVQNDDAVPSGERVDRLLEGIDSTPGVEHSLALNVSSLEASAGGDTQYVQATVASGDLGMLGQKLISGVEAGDDSLTVSENTAEALHLAPGSSVTVLGYADEGEDPKAELTVSGIRAESSNPMMAGFPTVQVGPELAKQLGLDTVPEQILVSTTGNTSKVSSALETLLQEQNLADSTVQTPEEKTAATVTEFTGETDVLSWVLGLFAVIALVVTILVVSNTFAVVLAQRTRELALLRTLGAKRSQVRRMVTGESLLIGLVGSVFGVLLGLVVVAGGCAILSPALDLPYLTFGMSWGAVIAGLVVGVLVTWLASLRPARAATRVAPLAALRPQETVTAASKRGRARIVFGAILALLGAVLLTAGTLGLFGALGSLAVAFLGGLVSFIGVLMLGTLLIPWAVRMLAKPFGAKVAGRLAGLNALRHPQRTAAIGTALLLGVTLVCMMAAGAQSARSTLNKELAGQYPVDLTVAAASTDADGDAGEDTVEGEGGASASGTFTASQVRAVGTVNGVRHVELAKPTAVAGECASTDEDEPWGVSDCFPVTAMSADTLSSVLTPGAALPAEGKVAAGAYAFSGESAPTSVTVLDAKGGKHNVPVDQDAAAPDSEGYVMTQATAKQLGLTSPTSDQAQRANATDSLWISASNDVSANELVKNVAAAAGVEQSNVNGALPIRQAMSQIIDALLLVVSGLLAVAVVIALIGVSNTLSLSVIERTRENSLLRALGLKKRQLRGMLALEAGLIAAAASVLGMVLGTIYGAAGAKAALASLGAFSLGIPWLWLGVVLVVAVGASVLASVWPARRAAKLSPVEGLATE